MSTTDYASVQGKEPKTMDLFLLFSEEEKEDILSNYSADIRKKYGAACELFRKNNFPKAFEAFEKLSKKHLDEKLFLLATAASMIEAGAENLEGSLSSIFKGMEEEPEYLFLRGIIWEKQGYPQSAIASYEKAVSKDETFVAALFRLAYYSDLRGDEEGTKKLYEKCASLRPLFTNVLLNLGVIYEDNNEYEKAIDCYRKILSKYPTHARAKLYLRDAKSSVHMYLDEEKERLQDRKNQILATPISEFELSVRSRNCLNKMKIKTLGSLVKKSESELLSYKNFGETSLAEIKEILGKKGLSLGMDTIDFEAKEKDKKNYVPLPSSPPPQNTEILSTLVVDLELSVRSRKCISALGIKTVEDLVSKSEQELLSCKNFGQTSMQEIKRKLQEINLSLKP